MIDVEKKVIMADVDGTICESCQKISPDMAAQINGLIRRGYIFAFISGTEPEYLLKMISSSLTEKHYLLPTTGTQCLIVESDGSYQRTYKYSLKDEEKSEIKNAFEKLIETVNIQPFTSKEDQLQDRDSQIALSAIGRNAPIELKREYDPDGIKRREWKTLLEKWVDPKKYEITVAGTTTIDVTRKGLDKGWGIKKFCNLYNINLNSVLFFGDQMDPGGNDYPATKVVDYKTVKSPFETLKLLQKSFP